MDGIEFATKNIVSEMQNVTFKIHNRFVTGLKLKSQNENCKCVSCLASNFFFSNICEKLDSGCFFFF